MDSSTFLKQCKKNREILEFTYQDMANCLINMSAKEYSLFETGKTKTISKENLKRLVRVLCIEEMYQFDLNDYIDTSGLTEEEILDLSNIVEQLVGEIDD